MGNNIKRRDFLKLSGLFTAAAALGFLSGCQKDEIQDSIPLNELEKYRIITWDNENMPVALVKYSRQREYFTTTLLNSQHLAIIEFEISRYPYEGFEEGIEAFHQEYNVETDEYALDKFVDAFGLKDSYDVREINYILEQYSIENQDEKILIKS